MHSAARSFLLLGSLILSSSAFAHGKGPKPRGGVDCDSIIIHSDATTGGLGQRAKDVEHCLNLASETARAAYRNTMPYCKNIALIYAAPKLIELDGQAPLKPAPTAQSWEDFALSMGESAAASGCRDGILSALQQKLFTHADQVRNLFAVSELAIVDQFAGTYDVTGISLGLAQEVRITSSETVARITNVDGISTTAQATVTFANVPLIGQMQLEGTAKSFLGVQSLKSNLEFEGYISGYLNPGSLEVVVTGFTLQRVTSLKPSPYAKVLEALLMELIQAQETEVSQGLSNEMSYQLREAYAATDPFAFLATQEF